MDSIAKAHNKYVTKADGWEKVKLPLTIVHPSHHSTEIYQMFTQEITLKEADFNDQKVWGKIRPHRDDLYKVDYLSDRIVPLLHFN